jgi:hypothetical protein
MFYNDASFLSKKDLEVDTADWSNDIDLVKLEDSS